MRLAAHLLAGARPVCAAFPKHRALALGIRLALATGTRLACRASRSVAQDGEHRVQINAGDLPAGVAKQRIDAFLSAALPDVSRSRLKQSIVSGLVTVNGSQQTKPSHVVRIGDCIVCTLPSPPTSVAVPEDIPLPIVYEDEHVVVVNKPAGMVVHPSPGHATGTLVNALLHHCGVPAIDASHAGPSQPLALAPPQAPQTGSRWPSRDARRHELSSDATTLPLSPAGDEAAARVDRLKPAVAVAAPGNVDDGPGSVSGQEDNMDAVDDLLDETEEERAGASAVGVQQWLRPGVVHRLDKGTTGLIVVCRTPEAMASLGQQFKQRSVHRLYWSITVGVPPDREGQVETNVCRHRSDRKKMAVSAWGGRLGKQAVSTYKVLSELASGTAALVQWRLLTGRTHQIRVHAQHIGCPLLGDADYGGASLAGSKLGRGQKDRLEQLKQALHRFNRPALHAKTLGFQHPVEGGALSFDSDLPEDFRELLSSLDALPAFLGRV